VCADFPGLVCEVVASHFPGGGMPAMFTAGVDIF